MLRKLVPEDAVAMCAIEQMANPFPWSLRQFQTSLTNDDFGWGMERGGESIHKTLIGFILFSQVIDEATLLNIVIHPQWRRHGFARELLVFGLKEVERRGATRCLLEVRVSNFGAIELYSSLGFEVDGKRRDYYPAHDGREDALLMSRSLPLTEEA